MRVWLRVGAGAVRDFELGSRSGEACGVKVESVLKQAASVAASVATLRARPGGATGLRLGERNGWPGLQAGARRGAGGEGAGLRRAPP